MPIDEALEAGRVGVVHVLRLQLCLRLPGPSPTRRRCPAAEDDEWTEAPCYMGLGNPRHLRKTGRITEAGENEATIEEMTSRRTQSIPSGSRLTPAACKELENQ